MMLVTTVQEAIVREPGRSALLDPTFIGFALILLMAICLVLYLAVRPDDSPEVGKEDDAA